MTNTYFNGNGKYQHEYDKLSKIIKSDKDNGNELLTSFKFAKELYEEYYKNQNNNALGYDEDENEIYINAVWACKIDYIRSHVPVKSIMITIMDKMFDEEVSVEMEMMYESMMNEVIEYIMRELHLYIRDNFVIEFEDIIDLCKYPEYRYILRVGVNKGVRTGLPAMSLDELDKLADDIKEFVKNKR